MVTNAATKRLLPGVTTCSYLVSMTKSDLSSALVIQYAPACEFEAFNLSWVVPLRYELLKLGERILMFVPLTMGCWPLIWVTPFKVMPMLRPLRTPFGVR